jgi:hypothetical protein
MMLIDDLVEREKDILKLRRENYKLEADLEVRTKAVQKATDLLIKERYAREKTEGQLSKIKSVILLISESSFIKIKNLIYDTKEPEKEVNE